jgi:triosephosphate isomerase
LREAAITCNDVFAQHVDDVLPGAFTGRLTAEAIKDCGAKGSLINHSEYRIPEEKIEKTIKRLKENELESIVCTQDEFESEKIAKYSPTFIAVEPPELIGSGISVSKAKPTLITNTIEKVASVNSTPVLCGAGISNEEDVKKTVELGACGVLLASAFVKATDPKQLLLKMAQQIE